MYLIIYLYSDMNPKSLYKIKTKLNEIDLIWIIYQIKKTKYLITEWKKKKINFYTISSKLLTLIFCIFWEFEFLCWLVSKKANTACGKENTLTTTVYSFCDVKKPKASNNSEYMLF